jgi:spermidine/putrescine-binding protein
MKILKLLFTSVSTLLFAAVVNADSITVVSWGGAYTKSQVEAYHKPWQNKTGNQQVCGWQTRMRNESNCWEHSSTNNRPRSFERGLSMSF